MRRKYLTMNGVQLKVIPIRTGANTLWTAYAITKVVDPVATLDCSTDSLTPSFVKIATTSRPLKNIKYTNIDLKPKMFEIIFGPMRIFFKDYFLALLNLL